MPLRHSPRASPARSHVVTATSDCDSLCLSDPNDAAAATSNVSHRQKRKRKNSTDIQLANFMTEMKEMLFKLKEEHDSKLNKISTAIDEIKNQNNDIRASIEFLSDKYDSIVEQVNILKEETSQNQKYIASLEEKLERFERSSRSTSIEIKNIPVNKSETKTSLIKTVTVTI
ncbi:hypothetical protein ACJJTC_000759 [Scirpophaga incertulas]